MRILTALVVLLLIARAADAKKLLVLRADSSTDWITRKHIEGVVVGLARNVDRGVGQSDSTFSDIASAAGCAGELEACRKTVIETIAIDEVVTIAIEPASGNDVKVTVRRAGKTGPVRSATAVVDKDNADVGLLAKIGPLFGAKRIIDGPASAGKAPKGTGGGGVTMGGGMSVETRRDPEPRVDPKPVEPAAEAKPAEPTPVEPISAKVSEPTTPIAAEANVGGPIQPAASDDAPRSRMSVVYLGGAAGGAVIALVGLALWSKAGSFENQARAAPNRTAADLQNLRDLEAKGDSYALWGNVAFLGGVAIAGASGYLWWRERRRASVSPMVVDHGVGVAFAGELP